MSETRDTPDAGPHLVEPAPDAVAHAHLAHLARVADGR